MIYFNAGDVTYGYGPRQTFHLGKLLRKKGKLTKEQLDEAVATQASTENSKRLGEILIAKGFIDRADLEAVVKNQVEELLYSLLSWQSGSFKFYENQFPTDEEITVSLSVENVILEGLRRLDEQNMVRETLPDLDRVYTISASQAGRTRAVTLRASEWNIMALVNGQRTMNEVCQASSLGREESLNRLAQLKLVGIITPCEKKSSPASSDSQLSTMVNRLSHLLESYLSEKEVLQVEDREITTTLTGKDQ